MNTITGKIKTIGQPQQVATSDPAKAFTIRKVVLDCTTFDPHTGQPGRYNPVELEFSREDCDKLSTFHEGDMVVVYFTLRGYEYQRGGETRIFTKVQPYRIEAVGNPSQPAQQQQAPQPAPYYPQQQAPQQDNDGLPF